MSNYTKGRRREYQVMKILEKKGYYCIRSAGSHKVADVVAVLVRDKTEQDLIKFIQVKSGSSPYKKELTLFEKIKFPVIISKEIWIFDRKRKPPRIVIV